MEQKPKQFPRENAEGWMKNWDNRTNLDAAESFYEIIQRFLKEHGIDLTKNVKVLELGSGNAVFLGYLRKQGVNVMGIDANPRGSKEPSQVRARIERLPFIKESFDVILASNVFDKKVYKNQDHNLMMQEIARVLKHGGIFIGLTEKIEAQPIKGLSLIPGNSIFKETIYQKS